MKYSFLNKRIPKVILLFCFIVTIHGQKLTVVNTTNEPLIVNDSRQEMKINANHKDDNVISTFLKVAGNSISVRNTSILSISTVTIKNIIKKF